MFSFREITLNVGDSAIIPHRFLDGEFDFSIRYASTTFQALPGFECFGTGRHQVGYSGSPGRSDVSGRLRQAGLEFLRVILGAGCATCFWLLFCLDYDYCADSGSWDE